MIIHDNSDKWKDDMILFLAMRAYAMFTREHPELQALNMDHNDKYDDFKDKEGEAACVIRMSCSTEVRRIVKGL
jgi:hypothetical protein